MEGLNGLREVLDLFSVEEVALIFLCILHEVSLVFVSESMKSLCSSM